MSSDSQSIDKVAAKLAEYDLQNCTGSCEKVAECKIEIPRDAQAKLSDSGESEKLEKANFHHSIDLSPKKTVKSASKTQKREASEKLKSKTRRNRDSRYSEGRSRHLSGRTSGSRSTAKKLLFLPISAGSVGSSGCRRSGREHPCHIRSSSQRKHSHSHNFHGGNRVILITTPLSCCCCCQRRKR